MHALSLPAWLAERWLERFGRRGGRGAGGEPERGAAAQRARESPCAAAATLCSRSCASAIPDAAACRFAPDGIVLGRRRRSRPRSGLPRGPLHGAGRGLAARGRAARSAAGRARARRLRGARRRRPRRSPSASGATGSVLALDRHERRLGLLMRDTRRLGLDEHLGRDPRRHAAAARTARSRRLRPRAGRRALLGPRHPAAQPRCPLARAARRLPRLAELQRAILRSVAPRLEAGRRARLQYLHAAARGERGRRGSLPARCPRASASSPRAALPASVQPLRMTAGFLRSSPIATTPTASSPRGSSVARERPGPRDRALDPLGRLRTPRRRGARRRRPPAPTGSTST